MLIFMASTSMPQRDICNLRLILYTFHIWRQQRIPYWIQVLILFKVVKAPYWKFLWYGCGFLNNDILDWVWRCEYLNKLLAVYSFHEPINWLYMWTMWHLNTTIISGNQLWHHSCYTPLSFTPILSSLAFQSFNTYLLLIVYWTFETFWVSANFDQSLYCRYRYPKYMPVSRKSVPILPVYH